TFQLGAQSPAVPLFHSWPTARFVEVSQGLLASYQEELALKQRVVQESCDSRKCSGVTGSGRRLKDNAADWHNLILRWEKLNDEGSITASTIVNQRLRRSLGEGGSSATRSPEAQPTGPEAPPTSQQLEEECSKLVGVVSRMAAIVTKMERLTASERSVLDLETFQLGAQSPAVPLFHSWPTARFVEVSQGLLASYQEELALKQRVVQEVAHTGLPDLAMVYLSCWLHQPYIPADSRLRLESLLLETGHRTL
ncbi:hypothetical protein CRUP_023035, partial [Coryphaenoides rupestris]